MLLKAYTTAAHAQNNRGWLPLHIACGMKASLDIVEMLVEAFPDGVHSKNNEGNLPSDYIDSEDNISPQVPPLFPSLPPIREPLLPPYIDNIGTLNSPNDGGKSQQKKSMILILGCLNFVRRLMNGKTLPQTINCKIGCFDMKTTIVFLSKQLTTQIFGTSHLFIICQARIHHRIWLKRC